jgi:hypothetical protein
MANERIDMQTNGDLAKNSYANRHGIAVDCPAKYRIRIIGELEESLPECLAGLRITTSDQGNRQTITTLSGPLPDQAALFKVLMALYDMRLPLLSVLCVEEREDPK